MCAIVSPSVKQINTEGVKQAGILIDILDLTFAMQTLYANLEYPFSWLI